MIATLGLPAGLVTVELSPWTVANATLNSAVSPRVGGLRIINNQYNRGECTLGFNIRLERFDGSRDPQPYFVTNAHCAGPEPETGRGTEQGVEFGQPDLNNPIGTEAFDPPMFTHAQNAACPNETFQGQLRRCRYSDAMLVRYRAGVTDNFGRLARLDGSFGYINGTWTITRANYTYLQSTTTVAKVGATTGYTQGRVTVGDATCVSVPQGKDTPYGPVDIGITMLCQYQAAYGARGGDSGSPVFVRLPNTNYHVDLMGLHWGSNGSVSTFSPYYAVSNELVRIASGFGRLAVY
jgi:hypothetical protein